NVAMQLKYLQTILEAQEYDFKIAALCWSPNNQKLAVATCDRQILLYDEKGEKRIDFLRSLSIQRLGRSPQSDCIVYVYKIGEKWGEKKAICNKFPQTSPVTCVIWLLTGPIICGLVDGKVRVLQIKSNKSQSLFASDSLVVSLTSNSKGTGFLSGHVDGNVIRFYITSDHGEDEAQGRIALHSVPPTALAWPQGHIFVAGCDKKETDFTVAACSPSGQAVAIGSFDRIRTYAWNTRKSLWEETPSREIVNFYTVTALAWKRDGSKVTCGGLCGAVLLFESVLKRTVWKDKFEITYVGPSQVLVKPLNTDERSIILRSQHGGEIDDVKIMGKDGYLVARTDDTLLVADLIKNLLCEVPWNNSARTEKFYFENPNVCLIFNAGELTLIEYGDNDVLCSVRTEFANPHLISVRLNERNQPSENKKLAYLLDLKTICVVDLINGFVMMQVNHDSKIDWLELSETGHKLLFRDKKQRLVLADTATHAKETIFTGVSFVQWVESSDVAVAQAGNHLAIWYNIDLPENPTIMMIKGDVIDVVRNNGKTEAVCVEGNNTFNLELDEGLVEFGTAINDKDYARAILFLETMDGSPEADAMWHTLYLIAMNQQNLPLAQRCSAALGDVATSQFLQDTSEEATKFEEKYNENPSNSPEVWARLSILYGELSTAENIYLEQGDIEGALNMYKKLHKWDDVLRGYENLKALKEDHMSMLLQSGQFEKVGQVLEKEGKYEEALNMYMKSNKLLRIPNLLSEHSELLEDHAVIANVLKKLHKQELYEPAAEIYEKLDKADLAMECYRKGKVWNKAVDLARNVSPDQVVQLEEEWGDSLIENKQMDAAISHYIEAGCTLKALDAAVAARQWKKAVHIVKVIDDPDTVKKYYELIANYFSSIKDFSTAEKLFSACGMYKEAVDMYNEAGQWEKAHSIASKYLEPEEVSDMYIKHAEQLEESGMFRDAEKLYLSVNSPDLAIAMYKRVEQYDNMVRLVEKYHPNLLHTTHLHLGQQLEGQRLWECGKRAYRVAKQNGGSTAANQVAFLWARTLPIDSAIKLLNKYGILEACINYACETYQFDFAFQLCKNLPNKVSEVHLKYAMALEDDGKFAEAEAEFIQAGKPKEAVLMYVHAQNWINALRIAETHEPLAVPEVLQAQAGQCFKDKQFSEFEVLLLRAQVPELIVQKYKSADMWIDALRVCKDYLPHLYPALQAEYSNSHHNKTTDLDIETLLSRANEWAPGWPAQTGRRLPFADIIGALDLLAEQGQWARCIEKAKTHNAPILHKYVALYAAKLLKDGFVVEALNLYATHGAPAMPQNFNIYNHIAVELFGTYDLAGIDSYSAWEQLRKMLFEINEGLGVAPNVNTDAKQHFRNLLLIAHYYALRAACRQVPSLKSIGVKISTALLRYTDIIPADKAFYEAAIAFFTCHQCYRQRSQRRRQTFRSICFPQPLSGPVRGHRRGRRATLDHSDLIQTDFPSNIPLPVRFFLEISVQRRVSAKIIGKNFSWLFHWTTDNYLNHLCNKAKSPCIVTGYPVRKHAVSFSKSNFQANKDAWAKLNMGAKMSPESNVASAISFITKWCGSPN
ncbi:hypothetical protein NQ317_005365, partial [Molorchus minor]